MSYELLSSNGKYWTCHQSAWRDYLKVAVAFGWASEGAFFKCDELGFGEHPSGSYLGNDWQIVTNDDARAMAAALHLAVATIGAGSPVTDEQVIALKALETDHRDLLSNFEPTEQQRLSLLEIQNEYEASHPVETRTIRTTHHEPFDVNLRGMMDLADLASAGGFTIA